jgi:hypothetical protein
MPSNGGFGRLKFSGGKLNTVCGLNIVFCLYALLQIAVLESKLKVVLLTLFKMVAGFRLVAPRSLVKFCQHFLLPSSG